MRRARSPSGDLEAVDVLLVEVEDEAADETSGVLHQLALEAMALRATSPGDPRTELAADDAPPPPDVGLARRLWAHPRLRWAVVAVVLALAVVPVLDHRREEARVAALAADPAVLGPAAGPLVETWRRPGRVVTEGPDVLLVVDPAGLLRRLDPATGRVVWTAAPAAGAVAAAGRCVPVDAPEDPPLVACVSEVPPPDGGAAEVRVVVVDPTDGATRLTTTAAGALVGAEPVDGDLVVAVVRPDGRLGAARWDLSTGVSLWEHVSAEQIRAAQVLTGDVATALVPVWRPDSLTVGAVAVDLRTGEALDVERERRSPLRHEEHVLASGARVTWSWDPDGDSGRGRVTREGRGRLFSFFGPPLVPVGATDGSVAGALLTLSADGERLRALDLGSGRHRWSLPYDGRVPVRATAQVDGVALLDDGATVTAVDVRDGLWLWRTPVADGVVPSSALTDGDVVLLPWRRGDGALVVVARRLADAAEVWRSEAPAGTGLLTVVDHHLVAATGDAVVGLSVGPPPG